MSDLARKVRMAFGFGVTTALMRTPNNVPTVQVRLSPLELFDLPVVEQRGVASALPVGTPVVVQSHDGDRSNAIVNGSVAPLSRPTLSGPEDVALYGYGFQIVLRADGIHIIPTGAGAAPDVFLGANLHVAGQVFARAGSAGQVGLATHEHTEHDGPTTSPPVPGT